MSLDPFAHPSIPQQWKSDVGPWFRASFDSECEGCGDQIYQDDRARYVDGVVVCEMCGEEEEDA